MRNQMQGESFQHVDHLKIQIELLLKSSHDNSLDPHSREILEFIHKQVEPLEEIAKTTLRSHLDETISSFAKALLPIVEQIGDGVRFSIDNVEKIKQTFHSFMQKLMMLEKLCDDGLYTFFPQEEEERDDVSSNMIGLRDVYEELKITTLRFPVTSLVGMPGIGKTTLANKLFHDPVIVERFDQRVWAKVGKKCRAKDIPRLILAEVDPHSVLTLPEVDEEEIQDHLMEKLKSKKYLIVLDDVWDRFMMYFLHPYYRYIGCGLEHPFLHRQSGSRILFTSRVQQMNVDRGQLIISVIPMRLLNKYESWDLLRQKVFYGESCPPQFEKSGKKISENCEGLPLTIVAVACKLSKEKKTLEYWNEVAIKKNHQVFIDVYDEISKVLLPSYTYLPRLLQMCFLFIGLFPQVYEIPRSRIINIWLADGFRELNVYICSYIDAIGCLEELVINNVVMVYKKSTFNFSHSVKTCGLHSSLWHLSRRKSRETKFALILSNPNDCKGNGVEGQRRLSFNNNVLFGIKDVYKSVEDNCASTARSLLCYGPYHQYQVPICFRLELLRELDALSIRFYEFPVEVLQLVQLRYLALTSNGTVPPSISQLLYLQFLIVDRHLSIISCKDQLYLPVEIWSLKELKHLQVTGSDLPDPCGASLKSLSTLLNVSARSCTEVVLKGVPNLKELRIQIELAPVNDGKPLSCFAHISHLDMLHSLKCVIVNPVVVPPVAPFSSIRSQYLRNLSLSGLGYSWKEMSKIASLPNLSVLKLKNYAFQGPNWEVEERVFINLDSLVIADTDMVDWKFGCGAFKDLKSLIIKNCYKLKKIQGKFGEYLNKIELVDCNPSCLEEVKKTVPKEATFCVIDVHSSWHERKLKA